MRPKAPQPVVAEHAARFEIRDHCGWSYPLNRRRAIGAIEAHHPDRPGASLVVAECSEVVDEVTRGDRPALAAPGIERADLVRSFEIGCRRQYRPPPARKTRERGYRLRRPRRPSNWRLAD